MNNPIQPVVGGNGTRVAGSCLDQEAGSARDCAAASAALVHVDCRMSVQARVADRDVVIVEATQAQDQHVVDRGVQALAYRSGGIGIVERPGTVINR